MQVYAQLSIIEMSSKCSSKPEIKCQYGTPSNPGNSSSSLVVIM